VPSSLGVVVSGPLDTAMVTVRSELLSMVPVGLWSMTVPAGRSSDCVITLTVKPASCSVVVADS
jgi:hypothetical protein